VPSRGAVLIGKQEDIGAECGVLAVVGRTVCSRAGSDDEDRGVAQFTAQRLSRMQSAVCH
jgi:hypothetical protein